MNTSLERITENDEDSMARSSKAHTEPHIPTDQSINGGLPLGSERPRSANLIPVEDLDKIRAMDQKKISEVERLNQRLRNQLNDLEEKMKIVTKDTEMRAQTARLSEIRKFKEEKDQDNVSQKTQENVVDDKFKEEDISKVFVRTYKNRVSDIIDKHNDGLRPDKKKM